MLSASAIYQYNESICWLSVIVPCGVLAIFLTSDMLLHWSLVDIYEVIQLCYSPEVWGTKLPWVKTHWIIVIENGFNSSVSACVCMHACEYACVRNENNFKKNCYSSAIYRVPFRTKAMMTLHNLLTVLVLNISPLTISHTLRKFR